jgi:hypothetical protein
MALTKAQLMTPPGGPGGVGAVKGGTGISVSPDGTISVNPAQTLTKLVAGSGVSLTPPSGTGDVTINIEQVTGGSIPPLATTFFLQASAPTGWTSNVTNANSTLRIVSSNPTTGGSIPASTLWTSVPVTGTVTGSNYQISGLSVTQASIPANGSVNVSANISPTSLNTGNSGSHSHSYTYLSAGQIAVLAGNNPQNPPSGNQNMTSNGEGGGGGHTHGASSSASFNGNPIPHNHTATGNASGNIGFTGTPINLAVKYVDLISAYKNAP